MYFRTAFIFMFFMKLNLNGSTIVAVLMPGEKQTNKTKHTQNVPFYKCSHCSLLTQAAWCSHDPSLKGIGHAQHSIALESATDHAQPVSCSLVMTMGCICCFSHAICIGKCLLWYSIPTGKCGFWKSGNSFLSVFLLLPMSSVKFALFTRHQNTLDLWGLVRKFSGTFSYCL